MKAWWIRRKLSEWIITSSNIHYEDKCLRLRSYFLPLKSRTCFQFLGQPSDDIGRFIVSIVEFLAIPPPLRPPDSPPYANFYPYSLWSHFINSACCTPTGRVRCQLTPSCTISYSDYMYCIYRIDSLGLNCTCICTADGSFTDWEPNRTQS